MISFKQFLNETEYDRFDGEEPRTHDQIIKFLEKECSEYRSYVDAYLKELDNFGKIVVSLGLKQDFYGTAFFTKFHDIVKTDWEDPSFNIMDDDSVPIQILYDCIKPALDATRGARFELNPDSSYSYGLRIPVKPKNELQLDKILSHEELKLLNDREKDFYSNVNYHIETLKGLTTFVKNLSKNFLKEKEVLKIASRWWTADEKNRDYCFAVDDDFIYAVINPSGTDRPDLHAAHFRNGDVEDTVGLKGDAKKFFNWLVDNYGKKYIIKLFMEESLYPSKENFFR